MCFQLKSILDTEKKTSCTPGRAAQNVTSAVVLEDAFEFIVPKTEVATLALYRVLEEEKRECGTY